MGSIRTLRGVLAALRLTDKQLAKLQEHPEHHWRRKTILASGKPREIRIPSRLLTIAHQRLLKGPLRSVPIHQASYCERGKGGLAAARLHAGHPVLLHLDLKRFFPSVTPQRVEDELRRVRFDDGAAKLIAHLSTIDNQLPQGASTSVALGNLVLQRLDGRLAALARQRGFTYTRYVDDIGVSGGRRLEKAEALIGGIVEDDGWTIGKAKGGLLGVDKRHRYLGVVINSAPNLTPEYIKDLRHLIRVLASAGDKVLEGRRRELWGKLDWIAAVAPSKGTRLKTLAETSGISRPK